MVGGGRRPHVITVLLPPGAGRAGSTCRLDDDEAHHLRVRRAEDGEAVVDRGALDGTPRIEREGARCFDDGNASSFHDWRVVLWELRAPECPKAYRFLGRSLQ